MTQTETVKAEILRCVDSGMKNVTEIYSTTAEKCGVPRTTVRRVAWQLRADIRHEIEVLERMVVLRVQLQVLSA